MNQASTKHRVRIYIDGFNLYYGMKSKNWQHLYWLNVQQLAESMILNGQELNQVNYYTARISSITSNKAKMQRQNAYIDAVQTLPKVRIVYGRYQTQPFTCPKCEKRYDVPKEKMTDVNLGSELVNDGHLDLFDTAIVISGDSDLVRPIHIVGNPQIGKRVIVAFPPGRFSHELKTATPSLFYIGKKRLKDAQFPEEVKTMSGFIVSRPDHWKKSAQVTIDDVKKKYNQ